MSEFDLEKLYAMRDKLNDHRAFQASAAIASAIHEITRLQALVPKWVSVEAIFAKGKFRTANLFVVTHWEGYTPQPPTEQSDEHTI